MKSTVLVQGSLGHRKIGVSNFPTKLELRGLDWGLGGQ
jgi:hypothetical protein